MGIGSNDEKNKQKVSLSLSAATSELCAHRAERTPERRELEDPENGFGAKRRYDMGNEVIPQVNQSRFYPKSLDINESWTVRGLNPRQE